MKRKAMLFLALSLLLSGCSWAASPYVSVTPHREQRQNAQTDVVAAANYLELLGALQSIISEGSEVSAIVVEAYPEEGLTHGMERAVEYILKNDAIGAYAVESIRYELGTSSGMSAVSVSIQYHHSRSEIQRIRPVKDMEEAASAVAAALEGYAANLVLHVEEYRQQDMTQLVQDYARQHPDKVMETPQVTEGVYGTGNSRVLELIFSYRTSRDALRRMQEEVRPVFDAASLYVSGGSEDSQKLSQLYAFLMERFDYKEETSITPAYSLLSHGVGDSQAFATVYAAMCRSAGLECLIVDGARYGEPWTWNIVRDGDYYCHVDLLRCSEAGRYMTMTDSAMEGYVWDYSSYPACYGPVREGQPDRPEETTEPTAPAQTLPPTLPPETTAPTVPEETTQPTVPEETTAPTVPEETTAPTVPGETIPSTVPEETAPSAPDEKS